MNPIQQQEPDERSSTHADDIPLFSESGPPITSCKAMNRIVQRVNLLSHPVFRRGSDDRLILGDSRAVLQIGDPAYNENNSAVVAGAASPGTTVANLAQPTFPIEAWWTFDELSGSPRMDSISAIALTFQSLLSGGGSDTNTSAAGKFNNALDMGNGSQGACEFLTTDQTALGTGGTGFSIFGWFKILSSNTNPCTLQLTFTNGTASSSVIINFGNATKLLTFQFTDADGLNNYDTGTILPKLVDCSSGISTGTWYFLHLFFDPSMAVSSAIAPKWSGSAWSAGATVNGTVGLGINAAAATTATGLLAAPIFPASPYGWLQIAMATSNSAEVLFDEFGFSVSRRLRDSEITYLYNSGTGFNFPPGQLPAT